MTFPSDFVWGAACASFQLEGGGEADGKGRSVWDMFSEWPGKVLNGDTGAVSTDHYNRYREDVALMGEIELQAYRFSISWPRVLPDGVGAVNQAGLDFYDRLVDELLENGVQPWVTLFHWDFPYSLFLRGGWLNRASSDWFAEYTATVVDRLSDRVHHWMPINEPQVFLGLGHSTGDHAPGLRLDTRESLLATHNVLLAHGKSVQAIRAGAKTPPVIGNVQVGVAFMPASDDPADVEAARTATMSATGDHYWTNTWFSDPMVLGHYPEDGIEALGKSMFDIPNGDMETIRQPLDFYGTNIYRGDTVQDKDGQPVPVKRVEGYPVTRMDWPVEPEALYWGPRFLFERYGLPIVITENGMASSDWVHLDGKVHDPQRIDFLNRYLLAFERAIKDGIEAAGYFQWSFIDNFEWVFGYQDRFGITFVDYETKERTLKDSAYWYRDVIKSNGQTLHG